MNLQELYDTVEQLVRNARLSSKDPDEIQVGIVIQQGQHIGGTPMAGIKNMQLGFDWDNGKCLILPDRNLTTISNEDLTDWRKSIDKAGWDYYNRRQKAPKDKQ